MGDFIASCSMPPFMTEKLIVMTPAISIAPQNDISPSPCEKCKSPTENFAPLTCTGKYTLLPRDRFLISQFPPCSGRPGTVRAPSLPTFSLTSLLAVPAWTLLGSGGRATSRSMCEQASIRPASRSFQILRTSGEGAQPRMPGWMRPANLTPGMWREEQLMPSKSQIALAL